MLILTLAILNLFCIQSLASPPPIAPAPWTPLQLSPPSQENPLLTTEELAQQPPKTIIYEQTIQKTPAWVMPLLMTLMIIVACGIIWFAWQRSRRSIYIQANERLSSEVEVLQDLLQAPLPDRVEEWKIECQETNWQIDMFKDVFKVKEDLYVLLGKTNSLSLEHSAEIHYTLRGLIEAGISLDQASQKVKRLAVDKNINLEVGLASNNMKIDIIHSPNIKISRSSEEVQIELNSSTQEEVSKIKIHCTKTLQI